MTDITFYRRGYGGSNNISFEKYLFKKKEQICYKTLPYRYRNYLFHPLSILSKIHFLTHDAPLNHLIARINRGIFDTKIIQSWHGFPLKALGKNINNICNIDDNRKKGTNWFLSYGNLYTDIFSESYNIKNTNLFVPTGMPRNDFLFSNRSEKRLQDLFDTNNAAKRIIYCPTFRDQKNQNYIFEDVIHYFSETIIELLFEANVEVYLKPHKRDLVLIKDVIPKSNRIKLITDTLLSSSNTDLYEILNEFDLLITDYSSIYFDWLLTGKPVMFFVPDLKEYEKVRGFTLTPFNKWTPGPKSVNFDTLTNNIKEWLSGTDDFKSDRESLTDVIHQYQDGNSSDRVYKQIVLPILQSL